MVRLMIRAAGAVLVVAGAAGLGTFFSSRLLLRLRLLEDLRKLVFLLKGEILYGNSSLEEAFARAGGRLDGRIGRFAEMVAEGIGERQDFRRSGRRRWRAWRICPWTGKTGSSLRASAASLAIWTGRCRREPCSSIWNSWSWP